MQSSHICASPPPRLYKIHVALPARRPHVLLRTRFAIMAMNEGMLKNVNGIGLAVPASSNSVYGRTLTRGVALFTIKTSHCAVSLCVLTSLGMWGCQPPKESSTALVPPTVAVKNSPYSGPKYRVAIGKFENRSLYMNGLFADGVDRLGDE